MDGKIFEDEIADAQERMLEVLLFRPLIPRHEVLHFLGGQMRRRRIEDHADDMAALILRLHTVGSEFISSALALVLVGIFEHVAVQLQDERCGELHVCMRIEDQLQRFEITRNFLLVAGLELADAQVEVERFDFLIGQTVAFDPVRRARRGDDDGLRQAIYGLR